MNMASASYFAQSRKRNMPKKPTATTKQDIDVSRLEGLLNLFDTIQSQLKMNSAEAEELKKEIKQLIKLHGTQEGASYVFENQNGVKAIMSMQERENFDASAAMDVMNALPEKVASQYTTTTITKDLFYQALADGAITPEDAKKCVTLKPVESLTVKKDEGQ
jgi:hypothetical protein